MANNVKGVPDMTTDKPTGIDPFARVLLGHADWLANHPNNPVPIEEHWNRRFSFECGPGWAGLLERLFNDLSSIMRPTGDTIVIKQLKEKFGTLRVYWQRAVDNDTDALIDDAILLAAFRSEVTCQTCGSSGQMRKSSFSWYHVACNSHAQRGDRIVAREVIGLISADFGRGTFYEITYDLVLDAGLKRRLSRKEYESLTRSKAAASMRSVIKTPSNPVSTSGDEE
jgi:hypothetical protein